MRTKLYDAWQTYRKGRNERTPEVFKHRQHIQHRVSEAMSETKLIPLNHGKFALVDAEDYDYLMQWKWHYRPNGYAGRLTRIGEHNPRKSMLMHRQILNTPTGKISDHINGDRLDNRRCNLRICTDMQNMRNRRKHKVATSKYKGVSRSSGGRDWWETMLYVNGKRHYIGCYKSELDAALAYNNVAQAIFGEFACLNEITTSTSDDRS